MSNLPDYDEITRLRLRLAEVELQRDAFKAMAVKAVTEVIREVLAEETNRPTIKASWVLNKEDAEHWKARLEAESNG